MCPTCQNIKIIKKCILPVNSEILHKYGYTKIVDAIKEGRISNLWCHKCNDKHSISLLYGSQLFIESSIITALNDISLSIQLNEQHYIHIGCVMFHEQNSDYYTAYIRNDTNWIEYDGLLRKPRKACIEPKDNINMCIYAEI